MQKKYKESIEDSLVRTCILFQIEMKHVTPGEILKMPVTRFDLFMEEFEKMDKEAKRKGGKDKSVKTFGGY